MTDQLTRAPLPTRREVWLETMGFVVGCER